MPIVVLIVIAIVFVIVFALGVYFASDDYEIIMMDGGTVNLNESENTFSETESTVQEAVSEAGSQLHQTSSQLKESTGFGLPFFLILLLIGACIYLYKQLKN